MLHSDVRYALRQLRRDTGFALVAVLTLGVGIGATTVVGSLFDATVLGGGASVSRHFARVLLILLGAVGLLLMLACTSVSSLLLARAVERRRELALRATLGALRAHIFRQMLVESQVLALIGGGIGLVFAAWLLPTIQALGVDAMPQLADASIDLKVATFTLLVAVATGFLCGLAPAHQASTEKVDQTLRNGEGIVARDSQTIRDTLVICQVALAVVLLVGAGLLTNSFLRLLNVDLARSPAVLSGLRLNFVVVGLFAAIALGLASLGVYAVTASTVARRRREIGVRMALGAAPSRIIGITLGSGTRLILVGTAIGLCVAFGLSRFLRSMLYEIGPGDPVTYGTVILVLIIVATVANYIPARRATEVDPRVAFVSE